MIICYINVDMQERKKQNIINSFVIKNIINSFVIKNIINSFVIIVDNLLYLCCLKICASNQGGIVYGV